MGSSMLCTPFTVMEEEELVAACLRLRSGLKATTVGEAPETSSSSGSIRTLDAPSPSDGGLK